MSSESSPVPIAGPGPGDCGDDDDDDVGGVLVSIECGPNVAQLSLTRLQQGSRGACVRFDGSWITPNQFQLVSGRETAKDWKRSIKHNGKSLKVLLANDVILVQPPVCLCEDCTGQPAPPITNTKTNPKTNIKVKRPNPAVVKTTADVSDQVPTLGPTTNKTEKPTTVHEAGIISQPGSSTDLHTSLKKPKPRKRKPKKHDPEASIPKEKKAKERHKIDTTKKCDIEVDEIVVEKSGPKPTDGLTKVTESTSQPDINTLHDTYLQSVRNLCQNIDAYDFDDYNPEHGFCEGHVMTNMELTQFSLNAENNVTMNELPRKERCKEEEPGVTVGHFQTTLPESVTRAPTTEALVKTSPNSTTRKANRLSDIISGLHRSKGITPLDHHSDNATTDLSGNGVETPRTVTSLTSRGRLRQFLTDREATTTESGHKAEEGDTKKPSSIWSVPTSTSLPVGRVTWNMTKSVTTPKVATVPPITRPVTNVTATVQSTPGKQLSEPPRQQKHADSSEIEKIFTAANFTLYLPYYASLGLANMMMVPYLAGQAIPFQEESKTREQPNQGSSSGSVAQTNTTSVVSSTPSTEAENTTAPAHSLPISTGSQLSVTKSNHPTTDNIAAPLDLSANPTAVIKVPPQKCAEPAEPILDLSVKQNHSLAPTTSSVSHPQSVVTDSGAVSKKKSGGAFPGSEGILNPTLSALSKWTTDDVTKFVSSVDGCQEYIQNFQSSGVCGRSLPFLSLDHMTRLLNMKSRAAVSLRAAIDRLLLLPDSVLSNYV